MAAVSSFLLITASLLQPAPAFWRLPCISPVVAERADPITISSSQVHTIMDGNAVSPTTTSPSPRLDTYTVCAGCSTPGVLDAPSICCLRRSRHGFTPNDPVEAFPAGLGIPAADPNARARNVSLSRAISWACLDREGPAKQNMGEGPGGDWPDGFRARGFVLACCGGGDLGEQNACARRLVVGGEGGECAGSQAVGAVGLFYGVGGMGWGETRLVVWDQGDLMGLRGDVWMGWEVGFLRTDFEMCMSEGGRGEGVAVFGMAGDALAGECAVVSQVVVGALGALSGCYVVRGWLGCGTGAGDGSSVSATKTMGGSSEVVSSGVAGVSSLGSPVVLSASPNHADIPSSPTNSTHTEEPSASSSSATSDHPLSAAPGTKTSITISVTKILSVTIITSSASVSSVVLGPSTFSASTRSNGRTHAGLQGQQLYGDDLRLRKH